MWPKGNTSSENSLFEGSHFMDRKWFRNTGATKGSMTVILPFVVTDFLVHIMVPIQGPLFGSSFGSSRDSRVPCDLINCDLSLLCVRCLEIQKTDCGSGLRLSGYDGGAMLTAALSNSRSWPEFACDG